MARLVAALPPLAAVASILYLAVAYPSTDGDTIKGTYALAAAPALALCFGFAVDVLARRRAVGIVLGVALVDLRSRHAPVPRLVSSLVTADGRRAERRWVAASDSRSSAR